MLAISLFKYTTIGPLCLYFVAVRQWRPLIIAAGIHVALHLFAAAWVQTEPLLLLQQSLTVSRQLTTEGSLDIFALLNSSGALEAIGLGAYRLPLAIMLAGGLLLVAAGVGWWVGHNGPPDNKVLALYIALLGMVANVVIYHRLYDFVTLLIVVIAVCYALPRRGITYAVITAFLLLNYGYPLFTAFAPTIPLVSSLYLYSLSLLYYGTLAGLTITVVKEGRATFPNRHNF